MDKLLQPEQLIEAGIAPNSAPTLTAKLNLLLKTLSPEEAWHQISKTILNSMLPFSLHLFLFSHIFPEWPHKLDSAPAWIPDLESIKSTNISRLMNELNIPDLKKFHRWTVNGFQDFWKTMIDKLEICFHQKPKQICDLSKGTESPAWLVGAKLNIADSCFTAAPDKTAIIFQNAKGHSQKISFAELNSLTNRIANSLKQIGFSAGDAIAIDMPMTANAVAIYLGIIKIGGVVVSIADSFTKDEIATRLQIAKTKAIFTQDYILRGNKKLPLYEKVIAAQAPKAIVLPCQETIECTLRPDDLSWDTFLVDDDKFQSYSCEPSSHCNILFSSGTTATPKAIPWNHTTPIKTASDAYLHQNIQPDDVLAWPTNLGWMMGPWLIFAAFINKATIALYDDLPKDRAYGEFIQNAKVTMLGLVPTLVASWRQSGCMEGLNWETIKVFSSTGECSNPQDMLYLMSLAGYKPIIEYCGGTEIGGAYITSTVIEKNYPSVLTTAAMGLDFVLLDENGQVSDMGEVALIPPSIGLSNELLNADQFTTYYANMPKTPEGKKLRRHGDQIQQLPSGYYCILGRVDDTMNLGGIKISSVEIERVLAGIEGISESAAIAISPAGHGPSQLVIYAATTQNEIEKKELIKIMQTRINQQLNPLFKIHDVVLTSELPKTASNKIMRRKLRERYLS